MKPMVIVRRLFGAVIASIVGCGAVLMAMYYLGIRFVITDSVPRGMYLREQSQPRVGDYVFVCIPVDTLAQQVRRGVLPMYVTGPHGDCPDGAMPLVKRVIAAGGDRVNLSTDGVRVNGRLIPDSAPVDDSMVLSAATFGDHVLTDRQVWLVGRGRSWDSRYFGPADDRGNTTAAIVAVAVPLVLIDRAWESSK